VNLSELLRKLADLLDAKTSQQETADDESEVAFISPQQTEIELQKKSVGVDSAYDELDDVKRLSGIDKE